MKRLVFLCVALFCVSASACSQNTITGTFPNLASQQVKLVGFDGFDTYVIDSARVGEKGSFRLSFGARDYGMGYLEAEDQEAFIVILAPGENFQLKGETLASPQRVSIQSGRQNLLFEQYASKHPRREQTLSAWDFLAKIYQQDSLFSIHQQPKNAIEAEIQRIHQEDEAFLASLPPETYVSWFLPLRKLVSSVSTIAQYRTEEIPDAIAAFREMDYADPRLYKSGLLRETIEAHFWLIENSGRSLDSVFVEMNVSIDHMIESLVKDESKFNKITAYLFNLLEQRSLFTSSEYLALKVLNEVSCTIDSNLAAQLESYRAMKSGNTAPDFDFPQDWFAPGYQNEEGPRKLSDIKTKYTVVVFAASWCPACHEALSDIAFLYDSWRKHDVEVVFVSLDEDTEAFSNFAEDLPFISICDYQKWDSPIVQDWHVFATPTMYLLGPKREILLRPHSVRQMDAWVDWFLVKGNL